jgi:tRNA(Phe) wybutosine-synthesizing methylase Tyw3
MKKSQLREIIRNVIREESISKTFSKAVEKYQMETVKLQKLQDEQNKLVEKFKKSSGDGKEALKSELIKMHRRVKSQQELVDVAEKIFNRAILSEPVDYEE